MKARSAVCKSSVSNRIFLSRQTLVSAIRWVWYRVSTRSRQRQINDDPNGFRLPCYLPSVFDQPYEVSSDVMSTNRQTLSPTYFEDLYAKDRDPWRLRAAITSVGDMLTHLQR
jgi:hypothetical protein